MFPFFQVTSDFSETVVDLEVVLILQPLLERSGNNICDVPVIARQTVSIKFERGGTGISSGGDVGGGGSVGGGTRSTKYPRPEWGSDGKKTTDTTTKRSCEKIPCLSHSHNILGTKTYTANVYSFVNLQIDFNEKTTR